MRERPLRLVPGADVRKALEDLCRTEFLDGAFVLCGIGSLIDPTLRFAGCEDEVQLPGPYEVVALAGSITRDGAHLHMTVSSSNGAVLAGHVCYGYVVRTTLEVLLCELGHWSLSRAPDPATGYAELACKPKGNAESVA